MLPDLRTPLLWVLGLALAGALGTAAVERTSAAIAKANVAKAEQNLTAEKLDRERENNERNRAALRHAEEQMAKLAAHSTKQTEIANALQKQTAARKAADDRNFELAGRVRRTTDQLAAALGREERRADAAAAVDQEHRPDPFARLLAEGGQLLAEAGRVVAEGRRIVGRRDGEVAALTAVIDNDRALAGPPVEAGSLLPAARARLPNWTQEPAPALP